MTKQYTYIEYEKLSDAVRDWENREIVYVYLNDSLSWGAYVVGYFKSSFRYAKRVEIKEELQKSEVEITYNSNVGYVLCLPDETLKKIDCGEIEVIKMEMTWKDKRIKE